MKPVTLEKRSLNINLNYSNYHSSKNFNYQKSDVGKKIDETPFEHIIRSKKLSIEKEVKEMNSVTLQIGKLQQKGKSEPIGCLAFAHCGCYRKICFRFFIESVWVFVALEEQEHEKK